MSIVVGISVLRTSEGTKARTFYLILFIFHKNLYLRENIDYPNVVEFDSLVVAKIVKLMYGLVFHPLN